MGQKFFSDASNKLLITSRFVTLQGEGPYQGRPAVFIRLTYCNTNCKFCDTFFDEGTWFEVQQLVNQTLDIICEKYNHFSDCGVVVTGGEPSLQKNISKFLLGCDEAGVAFTQIESNGILPIYDLPISTKLVISPKCSEKTNKYLKPNSVSMELASCLKFVISSDIKSSYNTIPIWAYDWKNKTHRPIYVSPMNVYKTPFLDVAKQRFIDRKQHSIDYRSSVDEVISGWDDTILDREQNMKNHQYAAKYALDNGLWLTLQMQLYASIA